MFKKLLIGCVGMVAVTMCACQQVHKNGDEESKETSAVVETVRDNGETDAGKNTIYDANMIESREEFVNYMYDNRERLELYVGFKKECMSKEAMYDYEAVSEKCGKFIAWRVLYDCTREEYDWYRIYITRLVNGTYNKIANNDTEYYEIINDILKNGWQENYKVIVKDDSFVESKYSAFEKNYNSDHAGYVINYDVLDKELVLDSSQYIDPVADKLVAGYKVVELEVNRLAKNTDEKLITGTQQLIDYTCKMYEEGTYEFNKAHGVTVQVYVKKGCDVTTDVKVIQAGVQKKYPLANMPEEYVIISDLPRNDYYKMSFKMYRSTY